MNLLLEYSPSFFAAIFPTTSPCSFLSPCHPQKIFFMQTNAANRRPEEASPSQEDPRPRGGYLPYLVADMALTFCFCAHCNTVKVLLPVKKIAGCISILLKSLIISLIHGKACHWLAWPLRKPSAPSYMHGSGGSPTCLRHRI